MTAASMDSTTQPSAKLARISAWVSRRGPEISRLMLAEAKHVVAATGWDDCGQALHEPDPLVVIEHVEQAAVENGLELFVQAGKVERIPDCEPGCDATLDRLLLGESNSAAPPSRHQERSVRVRQP